MTPPTEASNYTLRIWRQPNRQAPGQLVTYQVQGIVPAMSFNIQLNILAAR